MKTSAILLVGAVTVVIFVAYAALLITVSWPIDDLSINKASLFGDSFGVLNSFFTGGAFLLILWTIVLQQAELRLQRKEMSRLVTAHHHQHYMDLINHTIADKDLAEVWAQSAVDAKEAKQNSYILMIMTWWRTDFSEGKISRSSLEKQLFYQMKNSEPFRRFWRNFGEGWNADRPIDEPTYTEFLQMCNAAYEAASNHLEKLHAFAELSVPADSANR